MAFLDNDVWLENKLEIQINQMISEGYKLSSTEGFYGEGRYVKDKNYLLYNKEKYMKDYKYLFRKTNFIKNNQLPKVWDFEFTKIWNCFITSM